MRTQTRGECGGLGIEVTMEKEILKVVKPIEDTPASKAGLLAGDVIVKLDGTEYLVVKEDDIFAVLG